jgi:hypothetical protein
MFFVQGLLSSGKSVSSLTVTVRGFAMPLQTTFLQSLAFCNTGLASVV